MLVDGLARGLRRCPPPMPRPENATAERPSASSAGPRRSGSPCNEASRCEAWFGSQRKATAEGGGGEAWQQCEDGQAYVPVLGLAQRPDRLVRALDPRSVQGATGAAGAAVACGVEDLVSTSSEPCAEFSSLRASFRPVIASSKMDACHVRRSCTSRRLTTPKQEPTASSQLRESRPCCLEPQSTRARLPRGGA